MKTLEKIANIKFSKVFYFGLLLGIIVGTVVLKAILKNV